MFVVTLRRGGLKKAAAVCVCGVLLAGWRLRHEMRGGANVVAGLISGLANAPGMGPHIPGTLKVYTLPRANESSRLYSVE